MTIFEDIDAVTRRGPVNLFPKAKHWWAPVAQIVVCGAAILALVHFARAEAARTPAPPAVVRR